MHPSDAITGSESPDSPPPARRQPAPSGEHPGEFIGPYKLFELIGEGGFGVVWLAERREPFVHRVALKIIKAGMDSRAVIARFEQERQVLAVMDHPNIAKVLDGGVTPAPLGSRPYFVMEHVKGEPITDYCDRHKFTTRQRLELFVPVCEAIQHAHTKGIIHRDLKPSNVLVTTGDGGGPVPKVIDFGVAKAISHTLTDKTIFTESGQLIGTPEYMSPEQAEMGATDVDTRTDVYSLGVLLYELLSGALPFDPAMLRSKGYAEIQRVIREVDTPRPSTRLTGLGEAATTVAAHHRTNLRAMTIELRRELEWVPLKALRKDRNERYRTPADLADDVRNYLAGRILNAGPESASYRARKFARRHRGALAVGAVILLLIVFGIVGTAWGLVRAEARRAEAEAARAEARDEAQTAKAILRFLSDDLFAAAGSRDHGGRTDVSVKEVLDAAAQRLEKGWLEDKPLVEAAIRLTIGQTYTALGMPAQGEHHLQRSLHLRSVAQGPTSPDAARVMFRLAEACHESGNMTQAREFGERAAAAYAVAPAADKDDIAANTTLRAFLRFETRDYAGAEKLAREAVATCETAGLNARPVLVECRFTLAEVLRALGRLDEAESLGRQSLSMAREVHGNEHSQTAAAAIVLAWILRDKASYDEAERLCREALAMRSKLLGPMHPGTGSSAWHLAQTLWKAGKLDEAETRQRELVTLNERSLPARHWYVAKSIVELGAIIRDRGRYDEAEPILLDAWSRIGDLPITSEADTGWAAVHIADLYERWGKQAKAEEWRKKAAAIPPHAP